MEDCTNDLKKELTALNEESIKLFQRQQELSKEQNAINIRSTEIRGAVKYLKGKHGETKIDEILKEIQSTKTPITKKKEEPKVKEEKPKEETKPVEGEIAEPKK